MINRKMKNSGLLIDFPRLQSRLEEINDINKGTDGSCCRLALTDADRDGRDLVVSWMRESGLDVRIDQIGNIIGIRTGTEDGPPVMTGSHLDTVATGGRYDGTYGVLAGIEAIRTLAEKGVPTRRALAVAVFTNEEGVRFGPDMMGSLVYSNSLSLSDALRTVADDGTILGDELKRIGYAGSMQCGEIQPHAFVELHIEQGPVLAAEQKSLGAVVNLQGIFWQDITIHGTANHAGTTPMRLRHDAAYCAARIAVFVRELAERFENGHVATVGFLSLKPNLVNVIAREARLRIDMRNPDDALLKDAERQLRGFIDELARKEGVKIEARELVRTPSVKFDEGVLAVIEEAARDLGESSVRRMTSGAGHDAQMMSRICPSAMLFVPSKGGISHSPKEDTDPVHLELGANVLTRTLERLANA
jgi:N-carbamoyl-L-amino-acid hydrolase